MLELLKTCLFALSFPRFFFDFLFVSYNFLFLFYFHFFFYHSTYRIWNGVLSRTWLLLLDAFVSLTCRPPASPAASAVLFASSPQIDLTVEVGKLLTALQHERSEIAHYIFTKGNRLVRRVLYTHTHTQMHDGVRRLCTSLFYIVALFSL